MQLVGKLHYKPIKDYKSLWEYEWLCIVSRGQRARPQGRRREMYHNRRNEQALAVGPLLPPLPTKVCSSSRLNCYCCYCYFVYLICIVSSISYHYFNESTIRKLVTPVEHKCTVYKSNIWVGTAGTKNQNIHLFTLAEAYYNRNTRLRDIMTIRLHGMTLGLICRKAQMLKPQSNLGTWCPAELNAPFVNM